MCVLYADLARRVAAAPAPRVQAGDCVSALGVVAGLQHRGLDVEVVWLDAHGDFNTWETTPSGFIGGMPLAMMAGLGEQTMVQALGLRTVQPGRIFLVGARDLDPGERDNLAAAGVTTLTLEDATERIPPAGYLYVHLDLDLVDPTEMPAVDYPARGGPSVDRVCALLDRLFGSRHVAAFSVVGWNPALPGADRARQAAMRLVRDLLLL